MNKDTPLVPITTETHDTLTFLAYATDKNITGKKIYDRPLCLLHKDAASRLSRVIDTITPLGLKVKIWDAYRPMAAQRQLFAHTPNPSYVSDPETGVNSHCRGIALDLTLIDKYGNELPMGTSFDDFRPLAHHGNSQISAEAQRNRLLLAGVMAIAGFEPVDSEWWHYQLPDVYNYPVINEAKAQTGIIKM
ncbi:MAG: D-alanyl-D-alanine dipeptidase [Candidatus Endonucleobacter sp. (ex Gigantidas childressi)]|nr:D-alanyl-D-alanine dipeptidase [Candidatus Endonucleobacter sp. (ex Gigantidas childressi)]